MLREEFDSIKPRHWFEQWQVYRKLNGLDEEKEEKSKAQKCTVDNIPW